VLLDSPQQALVALLGDDFVAYMTVNGRPGGQVQYDPLTADIS
jgi:hypothetical protein